MDSVRVPSPVPSDGSLPLPLSSSYSLASSLPGSINGATSYSTGMHRQMPWSSSSTDSSWSNGSISNAVIPSSQYHQLLACFNELQKENMSLLTRNTALESKVDTLMIAYNMLLTRIPAGSTSSISLVPLRQEDYPHVRFWTRQDWNSVAQAQVLELDEEGENFPEADEEEDKLDPLPPSPNPACARGKRRASQGINVTMKYIENEDGTVINGFRAAEIRRYARSLWVQMAMDKKLPGTWSDADAASLTYYSSSMAQRFSELRLCASDWKANLVATDNYPSWRHNWMKKKNKEGKRPANSHVDELDAPAKKMKLLLDNGDGKLNGPSDTLPPPAICIIPGTPSRSHLAAAPFQLSDGNHVGNSQLLPPYNLNFMIGNPLATSAQHHQTAEPSANQDGLPAVATSSSPNNPLALPAPAIIPPSKRSKGARMRPTKSSTTARNLCAHEWIKLHPQGTTDEFKTFYDNLSEEQRQVWEEKSKAASQIQ